MRISSTWNKDATCEKSVNLLQTSAKLALRRFMGSNPEQGATYATGFPPLLLKDANGNDYDSLLLRSISDSILLNPITNYQTADIWSQIAGVFQSDFKVAVVPRVLDAAVIPYMPALRDPYCVRVVSDDILQVDTVDPVRKPIKAFAIYAPTIGQLSFTLRPSNDIRFATACYQPDVTVTNGQTKFGEAPAWLKGIVRGVRDNEWDVVRCRRKGGTSRPGQASVQTGRDSLLTGTQAFARSIRQVWLLRESSARSNDEGGG